jgi:Holliday junction resolvase RusA-like endonuclease
METAPEILKEVHFTVPHLIPPSGNHYKKPCKYIGRDGCLHLGFKLTKETKAFYDAVAIFARRETVSPATEAERSRVRYSVEINVYLGPRQRIDFDNAWKCGLDSIVKAGVIHSDAAVDGEASRCIVHKDQRDNPRTEYRVIRMEVARGWQNVERELNHG